MLAQSCHPLPSVAVTAFSTALAAKAGDGIATDTLVAVAILCGQLSIGWCNDRVDAGRDRAAGRVGKPIATGELSTTVVDTAIAIALVGTVAASLALGWRAGLLHLFAVACGWAYNLGLKATVASPLPYAVAFAALPMIATLAHDPTRRATWWAVVAGAVLGIAGHLANTLPDLSGDRATGMIGLPQRFSARTIVLATGVALLAGSATVTLGPGPSALRIGGLVLALLVTVAAGAFAWRRPTGRWTFGAVVALVALDVLLLLSGPAIMAT